MSTVIVDVLVGVIVGCPLAMASEGWPETLKDTGWAVPRVSVAVTVYVVDSPGLMLLLDGEADRLKSKAGVGAADTIRVTDVVRVKIGSVLNRRHAPVMVMV